MKASQLGSTNAYL